MELMEPQTPPEALKSEFSDLSKLSLEVKERKLKEWREDPVVYFAERLGIPEFKPNGERNLDEHEVALLRVLPEAIWEHKAVVVCSANAMGKDWTISGRATLWFFECFGPCKVIQTATGERQVLDIMWNELKNAYNARPASDPMGKLVTGKLEAASDWFVTAFTTKEQKDAPGKFQGIHGPRLMIVVSEAQGVDPIIYEQIESLTMAGVCLPVFLGNPLTNTGPFIKMVEDKERNIVIHLDAYDCVNVKEKRDVIPGLVTWKWVKDKEERWNADGSGKDPRYQGRVRGQVPTSAINNVVSKELYGRTVNRVLSWWSAPYGTIGVDPALTGTDDMVISVFKSGKLVDEWVIPYNENETVAAGKIQMKLIEHFPFGGAVVVIDSDGLGIKVHDAFVKMVPQNTPNETKVIAYRGSCSDREIVDPQYQNTRAEAHFYAKQRMMDGHICLDDNDFAREEATAVLYFTNQKSGRLQIEDKDDLKARILRSPNRWDSRVCGIWGFKFAEKIKAKDAWRDDGADSLMRPSGSAMAS